MTSIGVPFNDRVSVRIGKDCCPRHTHTVNTGFFPRPGAGLAAISPEGLHGVGKNFFQRHILPHAHTPAHARARMRTRPHLGHLGRCAPAHGLQPSSLAADRYYHFDSSLRRWNMRYRHFLLKDWR